MQLAQWLTIRLDDAALKELSIATGGLLHPAFAPSTYAYTYYPAVGATEITPTAKANNDAATVSYSVTEPTPARTATGWPWTAPPGR